MTELLQVDHLSKQYPGFTLQDISFSVKPGRIMGLIGKNGAGKSTTLKSILNMVRPESGTVTMLGKDFYANEKECKQDIGVVFGGIDFYPLKKLSAITAVTRRFYKDWDQERYHDYLRQFSLDENKQFRSLSNGMKVKYLLALALSHHAELLILDEPTSGLDPVSREDLLREAWGWEYLTETKTVDTHIKRLRDKIESAGYDPGLVETVRGYGYRFRQ